MATFLRTLVLYGGVMLAFTAPLIVVCRRRRRPEVMRGFFIAVAVAALIIAIAAATSERLVAQCEAAGNTACIDSGSVGMQAFVVVVYSAIALVAAVVIHRD